MPAEIKLGYSFPNNQSHLNVISLNFVSHKYYQRVQIGSIKKWFVYPTLTDIEQQPSGVNIGTHQC